MSPLIGALAAGSLVLGLVLAVAGLRKAPERPPAPSRTPAALRRLSGLSPRTKALAGIGIVLGLLVAIGTGWLLALILIPAALVWLPMLLSRPQSATRIDRLEAMEEWARSLSGVLTAGYGLEQALVASLRSTSPPIRREVATLVARLRARWSTADALRAFADDLNDSTGDLLAANLILAAERRGAGLAQVLDALAESVAADVRSRRQIEADRAKPRTTARIVTIVVLVAMGGLALSGTYVQPYTTAAGQIILIAYLAGFVALLIWMRVMAAGKPTPRFIGETVAQGGTR